jgi:hypothetical protein
VGNQRSLRSHELLQRLPGARGVRLDRLPSNAGLRREVWQQRGERDFQTGGFLVDQLEAGVDAAVVAMLDNTSELLAAA